VPQPRPANAVRRDRPHSTADKATRKARVEAVKDALQRSSTIDGPQVRLARTNLKNFLRELNEPRQPSDAMFEEMLAAPFRERREPNRR
jgi:hypothetical protein